MSADVVSLLGEFALSPLQVELPLPYLLQFCCIVSLLHSRGVFKWIGVERVGRGEGVFVIT